MSINHSIALATGLSLCVALGGCHLIFRYEDRPADGGSGPDLVVKKDRGQERDGKSDRTVPRDLPRLLDAKVKTWKAITPSPPKLQIIGLWGDPTDRIFMVGLFGAIWRMDSPGKFTSFTGNWTNPPTLLTAVGPLGTARIITVGSGAEVQTCHRDTGSCASGTPGKTEDPGGYSWNGAWCSDKACYLAGTAGSAGALYRISAGTAGKWKWAAVCPSKLMKPVLGVSGVSDNTVYAVGRDSTNANSILVRVSGGSSSSCNVMFGGANSIKSLAAVWATTDKVLAVGKGKDVTGADVAGAILVDNPNAMFPNVRVQTFSPHPPLRAVFGHEKTPPIMAGEKGIVLRHDGGKNVTDLKQDRTTNPITSVWVNKDGDIYAAAGDKLLRYK